MKELKIEQADGAGWRVWFNSGDQPVLVGRQHWVGVDFDGTLARNDNIGHSEPPYPLGEPIPEMMAKVKMLLTAGITVKIFTARACEPQYNPIIQDWTERNGLGRLEVTNRKDFNLIRFYDDRAIPIMKIISKEKRKTSHPPNRKTDFVKRVKTHLAAYKIKTLNVSNNGVWKKNKQPYPHILPAEQNELNILETISSPFWKSFDKSGVELHSDFHHLNSSQAMCFNLFFPFMGKKEVLANILLNEAGVSGVVQKVREAKFEHIVDSEENTNFDFFMHLEPDRQLFFECKYTESGFGKAESDARHIKKRKDVYIKKGYLAGKVSDEIINGDEFFSNYQLLRNLSYLREKHQDLLFVIYPRAHAGLNPQWDKFVNLLLPKMRSRVHRIYLEDLVCVFEKSADQSEHWRQFCEKYLPN